MDSLSWMRAEMASIDVARALVSFAANWLLQSTLLIAAGLLAARLLRNRGAAIQSAIFRTTLAAALACPLATSLLAKCGMSGWSLEMPTAWTYEEVPVKVADGAVTIAIDSRVPSPAPESLANNAIPLAAAAPPADVPENAKAFAPAAPDGDISRGLPDAETAGAPAPVSPTIPQPATSWRVTTAIFHVRAFGQAAIGIALFWLTVSSVMYVRLLRAWRRLNQLRRAAAPAELAAQRTCRELSALLNVTAPELLRSPYLASPCLAGLRRPAVLLPEADPSLPVHDVLIHELAHLRRRDGHWNLLRRLAEAAFFYQPLLWLLTRRLEAAAEEVCDDYVVHFGGNRERYARGLVEIAELSAVPLGAAGVAMVSLRSILARRIARILDSSRSLSTRVGNLLLAVVIAAGLGGVMAAGFVGLGSQRTLAEAQASADVAATVDGKAGDATSEEGKPEGTAAGAETKEKPEAEKEQANQPPVEAKATPANQFEGVVTGANGKPIAGAKLYWFRTRVHDIAPQPPRLLATADKDGRYSFLEPAPVPAETPASWAYMDSIVIVAPGHGFKLTSPGELRRETNDAEGIVPTLGRAFLGGRKGAASLPAAGDPIRGRLVDINGQPVAGAKVRIRWFSDEKNQLGGLEEAKARGIQNPVWQGRVGYLLGVIEPVQLREVLPSAVTDAEGRFELRDIGARRLVQLLVERDGIETTEIVARDEPGEKIVLDFDRHEPGRKLTVYPEEFLHAIGPSKSVIGRVLDLDSGEPIVGAMVRAFAVHGEQVSSSREREHFAVRTDAEGRYRITGLPVGKENKLVAFATGDVAYLPIGRDADTSAPGAELELDFRLKRGVWAEGRVYDAETRKPFAGEMSYYFFRDRKQETAIPGLRRAFVDGLYWTNADGEFRVPVLPTRGILAFLYFGPDRQADGIDRFPRGFGADKIAGSENLGGAKAFPTNPFYLMPTNYERIAEVPATDGQETVRVDMPLFASPPVTVRVVDADGNPATRFQTYGANERWGWQSLDGPQFEIQDLQPGERRKVFVFQRESNLAGGVFVEYGTKEAVEIKLAKAGSVRGRLVDADGEPIDDATLEVLYEKLNSDDNSAIWAPHPDLRMMPTSIPVDKQGRFRLDGLIPGWNYHARASAPRPFQGQTMSIGIGSVFTDVQVEAGEEKDLGDVTAEDNKPNSNKAEAKDSNRSQEKTSKDGTGQSAAVPAPALGTATEKTADDVAVANEVEFAGIVTDAEGKPVADAEIWFVASVSDEADLLARPIVRRVARSDQQGKFAFRLAPLRREGSNSANWTASLDLIAKAPGHGYDWLPLAVFEKNPAPSSERDQLQQRVDKALGEGRFASRALKLPLEAGSVRGRLIDVEGRPLPEVTVSVEMIWAPDLAVLDRAFETSLRELYYRAINTTWRPSRMGRREWQTLMPAVKTNENGDFSLPGLGRGQMATVTLAGERVAAEQLYILGREMETKRIPHLSAKGAEDVFVGVRFTHAVGPGMAISGRVTEFQSGKPIAGARVFVERLFRHDDRIDSAGRLRLDTRHIQDVTDEQGEFRLIGIPPGTGHVLNVVPPTSEPWLMAEQEFSLDADGTQPEATVNVQVCRGIWIEGRLTDAATGEPAPGRVDYLALQKNPNTPEKHGLREAWEMSRFPVDSSGRYRVAGLPGPGVLLVRSHGKTVYPLSVGADQVDGYDAEDNYLPTTPTFAPLSNWNLIRQIDPPADAASYSLDLTLSAGSALTGRLVSPGGQPAAQVEALGLVPKEPFFEPLVGDRFTVHNYEPAVPRDLFFRASDNSLVARFHLEGEPPADLIVRLQPAVTVKGRLIETETEAEAAGYKLFCESTKQGVFRVDDALTDENGRFVLKGLLAGNVYKMDAANPRHFINRKNGFTIDLTGAKPADVIELGDVTGPEAKRNPQADQSSLAPDRKPQSLAAATNMKADSPARESKAKVVRGRVTRNGRPAGGAQIAAIARRMSAQRGDDFGRSGEILAETTADEKGDFVLHLSGASSSTHADACVIGRQEGAAIAYQQLNLDAAETEAAFELVAEEPIRGKLIDLEGRPAAGVRMSIRSVVEPGERSLRAEGVGFHGREKIPAAWPPAVRSDEQGRFVIHGIPAGRGVMLSVEANDRFAPQEIALNTGWSEQRGERDGTYRPLVKNLKPGEEAVLALAPAQPFEGVVRYADSGEPAPHAQITIWASQQERFGSMSQVAGSADEQGHYRIIPKPGVRFGLTAYPPAGVPYLARQTPRSESIRWKASEQVKQIDFSLPRGVLVRGKVVEADGKTPVAGAAIQYIPEAKNNSNNSEDILTGWQAIQLSDDQGQFVIAVLPGPGRLLVHGALGKYVLHEVGGVELYEGRPGGQRCYAHAIAKVDLQPGQDVLEVKFELQPGAAATGRIVDEQGNPIEEATVISRLNISPYSLFWRGHTTSTLGGRFELRGLADGVEYPVYFLDPKRRLGATEIVKAGDTERTVVLKPCGQARLRLVDNEGAPVAGQNAMVEMVVTPGPSRYDREANREGELDADADFIPNVDPINHRRQPASGEQGYLVGLHALIPGASYRVIAMRGGRLQAVKEFRAKSNETLDLGDVVVEQSE